jgi:predicted metal-dependent hydrolase
LRHRARVHEREKREKLKKQGKLDEYLKEIEANKPKSPTPEPQEDLLKEEQLKLEKALQEYKEWKRQEELEQTRFIIDEKKVQETALKIRRRKRIAKRKQEIKEETKALLGYEPIDEPTPFRPKMAGKTGMPSFFFSNVVKQNAKAFVNHIDKNKMRSSSMRF